MNNIKQTLESFLTSEEYTNTSIHYDINAIKIRLHQNQSENRYIYFYIYHPWRISLNQKILNSSGDCPYKEDNESQKDHEIKFILYCKKTKLLERFPIKKIAIDSISNDLSIVWENGAILESSSLSSENWSYHIYDYINGVMYDVYYNRIEKDTFDVSDRTN